MTEKTYTRRRVFNYTIERRLQVRMLFKIWAIILISLIAAGTIFFYYSNINVGNSYRLFHVKAKNFLDFLMPVLAVGSLVGFIFGIGTALFFPHAFAGAIHRIERHLREIGKGDLTDDLKLRKSSELQNLAGAINEMAGSLRARITELRDRSREIEDQVGLLSREDPDGSLEEISKASASIRETLETFKL